MLFRHFPHLKKNVDIIIIIIIINNEIKQVFG